VNRRQLGFQLGSLLALNALDTLTSLAPGESEIAMSESVRRLYNRAVLVDCNLTADIDISLSPAQLEVYRNSGLTAIKTTIGGYADSFEATLADMALHLQVIELHPEVFVQVRRVNDIADAKRQGRFGIIFSFEGVQMLEGKLERIELFRRLGVRVMQLCYNAESPFAMGVLGNPEPGLTRLGRSAVAQMNELGIAIDLSHANEGTTDDVLAISSRPVLITHAGCSAVHVHLRNKTDRQLRALAEKGGVIGIYDLPYLTASPRQPELGDYMDHMTHALAVCGEDCVGIGSDVGVRPFDTSPQNMKQFQRLLVERQKSGVAAPEEDRPTYVIGLNVPNRCEVIADALLKRGYSSRVTEKVLGKNFVRAFRDIWGR
jgi:membrane dipeptidase